MSKLALAIFVKTPGHSPIKTRLGESIGTVEAERFFTESCSALEKKISYLDNKNQIDLFWAVAEPEGLSSPIWSKQKRILQRGSSLGEILENASRDLFELGYEGILFMGGDCPQFLASDLDYTIGRLIQTKSHCVIAPASDGGFNLFATNIPNIKDLWSKIPYSCDTTNRRLKEELDKQSVSYEELNSEFDIDTYDDYQRFFSQINLSKQPELENFANFREIHL